MSLARDTGGNVLPLAAIAMVLTAAMVGGGIDMSRAYRVQNRLQSACDSSVLAGRRAVGSNGYDTTAKNQANAYFATNFDDGSMEASATSFTSSTPDNGQTVAGTAKTTLNLAVMKIFGFQQFALSVDCSASMGVGNSDVVMVLDTTGSMGNALGSSTRIVALRTAMKNFYTTVKTATQGTNARIRYGFVPYSSTVNVGRLLYDRNPDFLRDTWTIQSRIAKQTGTDTDDDNLSNGSKSDLSTSRYDSLNACNSALPANSPWTNNGPESNLATSDKKNNGSGNYTWTTTVRQPQQRTMYECTATGSKYKIRTYVQSKDYDTNTDWTWNYQPVTYDVSNYRAFAPVSINTNDYGGVANSTWAGCIEERGGKNQFSTFSYSTTSGISPASALDLDIDSEPTTDPNTQWAPLWPEAAFYRYSNSFPTTTGVKASSPCPYKAQLLAEMTQSDFNSYADSMNATGNTYLDIGMVWGGRLSSPDGIFKDNVKVPPNNGGEVSRHIIFMTDGLMEPNNYTQSAWGIEYHDRRVTSDGSSNDASRHTSRFLAICEAIKAKGIRIWAISFTSGTNSSLSTCASADSYYNANDATALDEAFQEIAKQVGELRLTQ